MKGLKKKETISLRVDADTKEDAEKVFKELGLNTSVAINLFLRQVVRTQKIPFELSAEKEED